MCHQYSCVFNIESGCYCLGNKTNIKGVYIREYKARTPGIIIYTNIYIHICIYYLCIISAYLVCYYYY